MFHQRAPTVKNKAVIGPLLNRYSRGRIATFVDEADQFIRDEGYRSALLEALEMGVQCGGQVVFTSATGSPATMEALFQSKPLMDTGFPPSPADLKGSMRAQTCSENT
jgi:hypothetical protein